MTTKPAVVGYSVLTEWNPTQKEIKRMTDILLQQVDEGNISAMKAVTLLTALATSIEDALKELKGQALEEMHRYPSGQAIVVSGADITIKEAGVRYDYDSCGDVLLNDLSAERESIDTQIKERQKMLRNIKGTLMVVDERTGELSELRAPSKSSTTTFSIRYPKE